MVGVILLAWIVNALLLFAAGRFTGSSCSPVRILLGSLLGALVTGLSILPGNTFLHTHFSRGVLLLLICTVSYGLHRKLLWQFGLFVLLHFSIGGLAAQTMTPVRMTLGALGISLACVLTRDTKRLIPVELTYGQRHLKLTALYDTGNTLVDPLTGEGVLILDAPSAQKLTGLTLQQINTPIESLGALPGLRLIPYHTVGNTGFLLALRLQQVRVQKRQGSTVVAFAPQTFGRDYQVLTGGRI